MSAGGYCGTQETGDATASDGSDLLNAAETEFGPEAAAEAQLSEFPTDSEYADQVRLHQHKFLISKFSFFPQLTPCLHSSAPAAEALSSRASAWRVRALAAGIPQLRCGRCTAAWAIYGGSLDFACAGKGRAESRRGRCVCSCKSRMRRAVC